MQSTTWRVPISRKSNANYGGGKLSYSCSSVFKSVEKIGRIWVRSPPKPIDLFICHPWHSFWKPMLSLTFKRGERTSKPMSEESLGVFSSFVRSLCLPSAFGVTVSSHRGRSFKHIEGGWYSCWLSKTNHNKFQHYCPLASSFSFRSSWCIPSTTRGYIISIHQSVFQSIDSSSMAISLDVNKNESSGNVYESIETSAFRRETMLRSLEPNGGLRFSETSIPHTNWKTWQ